ncbi:hypothetical protein QWI29_21960 [Mycolicibacterium neoaurum]|nr:hypothetical protein [Mycolicibacterium neoaurum]
MITGEVPSAARLRWVRRGIATFAATCLAATVVGVVGAPSASADTTESLRAAVAAARGGACGPLRSDPVIDRAAVEINATTDRWINNAARVVPETDAMLLLRDFGYGGSASAILSSAAKTDGDAVKAALLQGYNKIPDCSFKDFGVSTLYNAKKQLVLATVVLAG